MKFFFVGDFLNNTGPGMANKNLRVGLASFSNILYSDAKNKIIRILEMIFKITISDYICFCSPSKANIIGLKIAKLLKKKSFYIMHGYLTYENEVNQPNISKEELRKINLFEKFIFMHVEKIYCVSKNFMEFMKIAEPDYKEKFQYNNNGLNFMELENATWNFDVIKKSKQIVSIGGGMRQKNNLTICKAIDKLNNEKNLNLSFVVIGLPYTDKDSICAYDFVTYYEYLPHEEVLGVLRESYLYIQNTSFETYGLSVIEALASNCNLLISKNVGAMGVFKTINSEDLIYDTWDIEEISKKIEKIILKGNLDRLKRVLLRNEVELEKTAQTLIRKMSNFTGEKL